MRINVIGQGYIGLPTSLALAIGNHTVLGVDINQKLIQKLTHNEVSFPEPGLNDLFQKALNYDLSFSLEPTEADAYILTVPTPHFIDSKKIDLSYLKLALDSIAQFLSNQSIVIVESTISPGTIDNHLIPYLESKGYKNNTDYVFAHAPERILPGNLIYELFNNSRTIGLDNNEIVKKIKSIYSSFSKGKLLFTSIKVAELSKIIENTYRDINIAYANELLLIGNELNVNIYEAIKIANEHPRVNILNPGPGVGGHCISVDPWFLVGEFPRLTRLIRSAREVNDYMPKYVLKKINTIKKENPKIKKIGVYGLTYKEDVDDIRESPTLQMINRLTKDELKDFSFFDPYIKYELIENMMFDIKSFIEKNDLIVIMVSHKDIENYKKELREKIVLDTKSKFKEADYFL